MRKFISLITVILCLASLFGCQTAKEKYISAKEVQKHIDAKDSEIDYAKYIEIEGKKSEIKSDKDNETDSHLMYYIHFKNVSKENITLNFNVYAAEEMVKSILLDNIRPIIYCGKDIELKPGKGIGNDAGKAILKYENLTKEQLDTFNKYRDIYYIELVIDGKKAYTRYEIK